MEDGNSIFYVIMFIITIPVGIYGVYHSFKFRSETKRMVRGTQKQYVREKRLKKLLKKK